MTTRKIRPNRKTRILLPFAADSQVARSRRPTEQDLPTMPPIAPPAAAACDGDGITIESEVVFPVTAGDSSRRRHQSHSDLKARRQTRNLAGRGWI